MAITHTITLRLAHDAKLSAGEALDAYLRALPELVPTEKGDVLLSYYIS